MTVASSAANELQIKAGIHSDVFPVVYQELKKAGTGSLHKSIFIVDEASQLSSPQGHELIKQIERTNARLILVGDSAQLPSVKNGRTFGLTQEYGIQTARMDEIVRQTNKEAREAVIHATRGEVKEAIEKLQHVEELESHDARIAWIANQWLSLPKEKREQTLLFAATHKNRDEITSLLREGLKTEGSLKEHAISMTVLRTKNIEPIQQRSSANYQQGDVLRFNQCLNKITQGDYYTIGKMTNEHRKNNTLPLIDKQGHSFSFALKNLPQYKTHTAAFERVVEVYHAKEIELNVGDKVMWSRNFKGEHIRNGECATIAGINDNKIMFKLDSGKELALDKHHSALKHLEYGYVLTNYKVQGKDAPNAIGLIESYHCFSATMKNFYVQISRAVEGMTLVTDNNEQLIASIQRNRDEKIASLDVLPASKLFDHQERYAKQSLTSLQSIIDKKYAHERNNQIVLDKSMPNKQINFSKELEI